MVRVGVGGNLRGKRHSLQGSYICGHNYLLRIILSFHTASKKAVYSRRENQAKSPLLEIIVRLKLINLITGVLLSSASLLFLS